MKYLINIFFFICFFGCSSLTDDELWKKVESAKANNNWDSTLSVCQRILKEYPKGRFAGWARFGIAESYRFKNQPREALDNYKLFYEQNPNMQPSALSLFLTGYIYNNNLQMYDSAKFFYGKFLEKYPQHDLAPTVRFELETIGKDPNQVLNEKQRRQKMAKK
ncbi:MAG: tetratricopeptide repeat protein [Bacteroidota bacterium]|nr:tetratricopeptide repeat protein [Bacteroidota bacterium]